MNNYYNEIKEELVNNEVYKAAKNHFIGRHDLTTYYNVGRLIVEAQGGEKRAKYGNQLIKEYSKRLTEEVGKGYSERSLKYMRKFYLFQKMKQVEVLSGKGPQLAAQLTWSHYRELLSLRNYDEINYYIKECIDLKLGRNALREKIKNKEYQKLSDKTKEKLKNNERLELPDIVKDPIMIRVPEVPEKLKEKGLKEYILNDMDNFLNQIGKGTAYIGNEYKLEYDDKVYFIDILLFSIAFNCYVVIELKVNELKKEDIIQTKIYTDVVDNVLREINQNKTIGLIVSRENNEYVIKFSTDNIIHTTYELVENK